MATTHLGLKNDYPTSPNYITEGWLNSIADDAEWIAYGYTPKSVAGGTDVTLTQAEYEAGTLVLTGLLTANINVILPTRQGRWVVVNSTTGAFTITVKTASGTGIVVVQGTAALLYGDGTNIGRGAASAGANGDVTSMTGLTGSLRAPTGVLDANGNEVLVFGSTASAVNELTCTNAATGAGPQLSVSGGDANIALNLKPKGTGAIRLLDGNGNELLLTVTTASAVNELTVTNAATGGTPELSATGGDTNISLRLTPKGTGDVVSAADGSFAGGYRQTIDGWYQDNVAASQTAVVLTRLAAGALPTKFIAPRAGSITAICVKSNEARTAGTLTVEVYKAGAATGLTAVLDGTNTTFKATTQAKDTDTFAAGDELDIRITTDAGWLPVSADIRAVLEIET